MLQIPPALVDRLRSRKAVLVVGSRCGSLGGLPDWLDLVRRAVDLVSDERARDEAMRALDEGRALVALERARQSLGRELIVEAILEAYPVGIAPVPDELRDVARVPWRGVISTSLDDLWPRALAEQGPPTTIFLPDEAAALAAHKGRFLLPLLGDPARPESLCLGSADVRQRLGATGAAAAVMDLHRKWSFVFIGFRPGDPDLALLGERVLGASASDAGHFLICPGLSASEGAFVAAELGVTPVAGDGDVEDALRALAEAWREIEAAAPPPDEDVEAWLELWSREPESSAPIEALGRAEQGLRDSRDWDRLLALHLGRAELHPDRSQQVASLREAARILEDELGTPARAYPVLVTALRFEPESVQLVEDLKRLARKADLWDEFVRDYGGFVQEIVDPTDSARHVLELARIYAGDEARQSDAIGSFEKVLGINPDNPEALAGLEVLYRRGERWRELARILDERAKRASSGNEARSLWRQRADLLRDRLNDGPAAIEAYEALVTDDSSDREALLALEALYTAAGRDEDLLYTLERLVEVARTDDERRQLLRRLGAGRARAEGPDRAFEAWEKAFALGERGEEVLQALARAYEDRRRWADAVAVLDRWVETRDGGTGRADLLARVGALLMDPDKADDPAAAEQRFAQALETEPGHRAALAALATLCRRKGDHLRAAKFLLESESRTGNPLDKARLLFEAGTLYAEPLEDEERAMDLFRRALDADPEHVGAGERLAAFLEGKGDLRAAEPVLDMLVRKADTSDPNRAADLHCRLAACALSLGKPDKALRAYEAARALTPEAKAVLEPLAALRFDRQEWAEALPLLQALRRVTEAEGPAPVPFLLRMGKCTAALGDPDAALEIYAEALERDDKQVSVHEAIAAAHAAKGDWVAVVGDKRKLAAVVEGEDRVRIIEEIGEIWLEKIKRPSQAIAAFEEALELQPSRRQALHRLLDLYTEHKHWPFAANTLARLCALETAAPVRAKYNYASAVIHRDELRSPDEAVALFNKALDDDPSMSKAFDAAERICADAGDFKGLVRLYRKMIKRLPPEGQTDLRRRLWAGLAEAATKAEDGEAALVALEVSASLEPDNLERHEQLARIYIESGPASADKAIAVHQHIVARQPDCVSSYQALAALYQQTGQFDKLWCAAGALAFMGQADYTLQSFWERHRSAEVPVALSKLNDDLWRKIVHPDEDPYIDALFALLAPALAMTCAQPHQAIGVRRGDRVDLSGNDWFPAVALRYVSTRMEIPLPDVFVKQNEPHASIVQNLRDKAGLAPALVLGQGFTQWSTQWEVVFDLGKRMALLRNERFPCVALLTPAALDIGVRAALALGGCPIGSGPHNGEIDRTTRLLGELVPKPLAEQLAVVARKFTEARGTTIDVAAWRTAADLTAARAAFVISSDLPAAARVLAAEPSGVSALSAQERLGDLLAFSVSEQHFAVRHALGLQAL